MLAKDRRGKERRSGRSRRANTTWATEILHESHLRMIDLFDDFADPAEAERLNEIRDLAIIEIRLHRALVEDVLVPAVRQAAGDPVILAEVQQTLSQWEPLLSAVERLPVTDDGFAAAWQALRQVIMKHIDEGDLGLNQLSESLPLDFVALGLEMLKLRNQILLEKPDTGTPTP